MSTHPFTPTQEQAEALDRRTVGRELPLAILQERLHLAATTKNRQHTLIVGPRGSGKTHLLQVALYRAASDPKIAPKLLIARIPEDAIGLTSYVDLLRESAISLGINIERERDPSVLESSLLEAAGERTIVLVIENLDRVFRALGEDGQRDLRSWVETSGQVLLLVATPALFEAVRDRRMPWFGGLIEMSVEGLSAEEGRELLMILASDRGDEKLVEALKTEWGEARVKAVSQLTAGSPRIWMVFSDCLNVETLDELIPAVEGLVEGLVPYYQSLLWDLPANQQAIVRQLAEGSSGSLTASEIADATGMTQQTISKALSLLKEGRWVRDMKLPGGDQRLTWYELREPMLRHHFQWRATGGEPLRLIVDLLKTWYEPYKLRRHLSSAAPGSSLETYLVESLRSRQPAYDLAMNIGTPKALNDYARVLIRGGSQVFPAEVGIYAELCSALALDPSADVAALLSLRASQFPLLTLPSADTVDTLILEAFSGSKIENLLQIAADNTSGDIKASLLLIAAGFIGWTNPRRSIELLGKIQIDSTSMLGFAIALDSAIWQAMSGEASVALQAVKDLLPIIESVCGSDDVMTLRARANLAYLTCKLGDLSEALRLYRELLTDCERVLGPDDRHTAHTQLQVEFWLRRSLDQSGIMRLLKRARSGDQEALMRLPSELRPLAEAQHN